MSDNVWQTLTVSRTSEYSPFVNKVWKWVYSDACVGWIFECSGHGQRLSKVTYNEFTLLYNYDYRVLCPCINYTTFNNLFHIPSRFNPRPTHASFFPFLRRRKTRNRFLVQCIRIAQCVRFHCRIRCSDSFCCDARWEFELEDVADFIACTEKTIQIIFRVCCGYTEPYSAD